MKMKIFFPIVVALILSGCLYQEPIRIESPLKSQSSGELSSIKVDSPRYAPLYSDKYIFEIRNGLAYFVEVSIGSSEKVYLAPGGQAYVPFAKSHCQRRVFLSGIVLQVVDDTTAEIKKLKGKKKLQRIIGTIKKRIRIPSRENQKETTGLWRIRNFAKLRE